MAKMDLNKLKLLQRNYPMVIDELNGRWVAVEPMLFTVAIIEGTYEGAEYGYERRWCYGNGRAANQALTEWAARDFEGEPEGWHRAVDGTGRRRPHGNKEEEYVEF